MFLSAFTREVWCSQAETNTSAYGREATACHILHTIYSIYLLIKRISAPNLLDHIDQHVYKYE